MRTLFERLLLHILPALLITTALWLPFGFSLGGLIEEWGVLELFALKGLFFWILPGDAMGAQSMRPLTTFPHALAYWLDPHSFRYWHWLLALSVAVKGISASVIGLYVTRRWFVAVLLSMLAILYPADTMQLSLRTVHINVAIALAFASCAALLGAYHATGLRRGLLTAFAVACYALGTLMYEVVAPMILLPLLAMYARFGARRTLDAVWTNRAISLLWIAGAVGCAIYIVVIALSVQTYQHSLVGTLDWSGLTKSWRAEGLGLAFYRAFAEGWWDAFRLGLMELRAVAFPLLAALGIGAILVVMQERTPGPHGSRPVAIRLCIAGLVAFLLGFLPFLSSVSHVLVTQRTYLAAALGAAMVVVTLILLVERFGGRLPALVLGWVLCVLAFLSQLYQFDRYNRIYADAIMPKLDAAARARAATPEDRAFVLLNENGYLTGVWDMGLMLRSAVTYVENAWRAQTVCEGLTDRDMPREAGPLASRRACVFEGNNVSVRSPQGLQPLTRPLVWFIAPNGELVSNEVAVRAAGTGSPILEQLKRESPWRTRESSLFKVQDPGSYVCRFESMWGYAVPCQAFGFGEGGAFKRGLGLISAAWIAEPRAGVIFNLEPEERPYRVTLRLHYWLGPTAGTVLRINGENLTHELSADTKTIVADIPAKLLRRGVNRFEIRTTLEATTGFSVAVRDITIAPQR